MKNSQEKTFKYYDIIYDEWMPAEKTTSELKLLKKYASKTDKILDIGCGSGRNAVPLHREGYDIIGLDAVSQALDLLKEKNSTLPTIHSDFYKANLESNQFQLIYMIWNAFAEIAVTKEKAKKLLSEIHKLLKSGGHYIFDLSIDTIPEEHLTFTQIITKGDIDYQLDWKLLDYDAETRTTNCKEEITLTNHKDNTVIDKVEAIITQRWWTKEETVALAESVGFSIDHVTIKDSDYLYCILKK